MSRDKEMTFIEHLKELKNRVKVIIVALIVSTLFWLAFPEDPVAFISNPTGDYSPFVSAFLRSVERDIGGRDLKLISGTMTAPLEILFIAAFFMGFITALPIIAYEVYAYVDPALYPHERRAIYGFVSAFSGLFAGGAAFAYYVATPLVVRFLVFIALRLGIEPTVNAMDFYSMVFMTVILLGLVFTAPAIFVILVRFGVIRTTAFTRNRLYIYGALYILIAFITPDGWLVGNAVMFLPLVVLLEGSVIFAKRYERKREAEEAAQEAPIAPNPGVRCKHCNAELEPQVYFCMSCGRSQR